MTEPVFLTLQAPEAALRFAPLAFDHPLLFLPHGPRSLSARGDPDLLDSRFLQLGNGGSTMAPPIVDLELGRGLGAKLVAVVLQTRQRHLVLAGARGHPAAEQVAPA